VKGLDVFLQPIHTFNITPDATGAALVLEAFSVFGAAGATALGEDFSHASVADGCEAILGVKLFFPVPQDLGQHPYQQREQAQVNSANETPLTAPIVPRFHFCACWSTIPRPVQRDLLELAHKRRAGMLDAQGAMAGLALEELDGIIDDHAEEGVWEERADVCGLVMFWVEGHAFGLRIRPMLL